MTIVPVGHQSMPMRLIAWRCPSPPKLSSTVMPISAS
jgi:hypothetical protein